MDERSRTKPAAPGVRESVALGLVFAIATTSSGAWQTGARAKAPAATVTAVRSTKLAAKVTATRQAAGRGVVPTLVTGGSGLARFGQWTYVAQDDSALLAAIDDSGLVETIRLFPPIDGADRFHVATKNKGIKPDMEAVVAVALSPRARRAFGASGSGHALLVVGSGSTPETRDRMAVVFLGGSPGDARAVEIRPRALYARLRSEKRLTGDGGQLNVEGVAAVDGGRMLRFYNRGNGTPGSITASVDLVTDALMAYLARAVKDPDAPCTVEPRRATRYDMGTSEGVPVSIGDAVAIPAGKLGPREAILMTGVAEATTDANDDGATSGTVVGLQLARDELLVAPVVDADGPTSLKIEGLAIRDIRNVGTRRAPRYELALTGIVDADSTDPRVPSLLVDLTVTYVP